ncbi:glycosyltransferase family 8 protein [Alsobacter sp. R-9]
MPARLAVCLTPDANFFRPAILTAASILGQADSDDLDVLVLCEEADIAPEYGRLDRALRDRIQLRVVDWSRHVAGLPVRGHFTSAVNRRLALHRILPENIDRYVSLDADMLVVRPGLAALAGLDLGRMPFAAAIDMIFLKDLEDGPLTAEFRSYRARLGLAPATPYFNNGFTLVDRQVWDRLDVAGAATAFLAANAQRCPYLEQSALNAVVNGQFAKLSPRYNFMGDFQLLDLEQEVDPIVFHFVNRPKPWEAGWRGDGRFVDAYRSFFLKSPWPELAPPAGGSAFRQSIDAEATRFRTRLLAFLRGQAFADGWRAPPA